jgi:hypothetical protein
MDFFDRLARGVAAARAVMGSDALGLETYLPGDDGKKLVRVEERRRRETGQVFLRLSSPLAEGVTGLDLSPSEARAVAASLLAFADRAAGEAPRITAPGEPEILPPAPGSTPNRARPQED